MLKMTKMLSTSNVLASGSHDQNQASTSGTQVQDQQASTSSHDQPSASNQVQILQSTNIAKRSSIGSYHW